MSGGSRHALAAQCEDAIQLGSKSFARAGRLLGRQKREAAFFLYSWCRHVDDVIDESPPAAKAHRLRQLQDQTRAALQGEPGNEVGFRALHLVFSDFDIPHRYATELLEGMTMDVDNTHYDTVEDLLTYCYRVAGVVGLMMCHILGVSEERALKHACDMGMAMQLTNIARDVKADFAMGRVYLPAQLLRRYQLDADRLLDPSQREGLILAVEDLLKLADQYYQSGEVGIRYLSWSTAVAIQSAKNIYASIGTRVRRAGGRAWDQRQFVGSRQKWQLVIKAFFQVLWKKGLKLSFTPVKVKTEWTLALAKSSLQFK